MPAGGEAAFLAPLPIERLWGVGASSRRALADYDVKTIGDLARAGPDDPRAPVRHRRARPCRPRARQSIARSIGIDVGAKSVSHEFTFDKDTNDWEVIERSLLALSEGVAGRLRKDGLLCSTVAVKIRDSRFRHDHPPEAA